MRPRRKPRRGDGGGTHDWALDLEPLALPPDLPPVMLRELVGWKMWWLKSGGRDGLLRRYAGVECRDDGLLAAVGGRGGLITTAGVLWCAQINLPH